MPAIEKNTASSAESLPKHSETELKRRARWAATMVLLFLSAVGAVKGLSEYKENKVQEAVELREVTLEEALEYLYLAPEHLYETQVRDFTAKVQYSLDSFPEIQLETVNIPEWAEILSRVFENRGVQVVSSEEVVISMHEFSSDSDEGYACWEGYNDIRLDARIRSAAAMLSVLAHEYAHIQADHCRGLRQSFVNFPEFEHSLGSDMLSESHAQLLALEALAEIALSDSSSTARLVGEAAFFHRLSHVGRQAQAFFDTQYSFPPGVTVEGHNPDVTSAYFYGYLPLSKLLSLGSDQEGSFLILRQTADGQYELHEIELRYSRLLLQQHGFFLS